MILLSLCGLSCKNDRLTVLLVDHACHCDQRALRSIGGLRVVLEGAGSRTSSCVAVPAQAQRLDELQRALSGAVQLDDLGAGSYSLTVVGYEDSACAKGVVSCGRTGFALPASTAAVDVPVRCQRDNSGAPTTISEATCLNQTLSPDKCTGSGGADGSIGDGGNSLDLPRPKLTSDGSCHSSRVDAIDSVGAALYTSGKSLIRRKCFPTSSTPKSLGDVQAALSSPLLTQLTAGTYILMISAYDGRNCPPKEVIACGGGTVSLPLSGSLQVQLRCWDDRSPTDDTACLNSLK